MIHSMSQPLPYELSSWQEDHLHESVPLGNAGVSDTSNVPERDMSKASPAILLV